MEFSIIDLQKQEACGTATLILPFEPERKICCRLPLCFCLEILSGLGKPIENANDAFVYGNDVRTVLGIQPEGQRPVDLFAFLPVGEGVGKLMPDIISFHKRLGRTVCSGGRWNGKKQYCEAPYMINNERELP